MTDAWVAAIAAIAPDWGGKLNGATCHVMIAGPWRGRLPAPSSDEEAMLELTAAPREPAPPRGKLVDAARCTSSLPSRGARFGSCPRGLPPMRRL